MVPGLARQQRFVLDLQPAQTIIKRYTFPNGAALLGKTAGRACGRTMGRRCWRKRCRWSKQTEVRGTKVKG